MGEEMNGRRRVRLREALAMLNSVIIIVDDVCNGEQDAADNYPENLQNTEKFEAMESAVESLNEAVEKIDEAKEHIEDAIK